MRGGTFFPDFTRSGRWSVRAAEALSEAALKEGFPALKDFPEDGEDTSWEKLGEGADEDEKDDLVCAACKGPKVGVGEEALALCMACEADDSPEESSEEQVGAEEIGSEEEAICRDAVLAEGEARLRTAAASKAAGEEAEAEEVEFPPEGIWLCTKYGRVHKRSIDSERVMACSVEVTFEGFEHMEEWPKLRFRRCRRGRCWPLADAGP